MYTITHSKGFEVWIYIISYYEDTLYSMSSVIFKTLPEHFASQASVTEVVLNARIKRSNQRSGWIRIAQLKVEMVMEKRPHRKWKQDESL